MTNEEQVFTAAIAAVVDQLITDYPDWRYNHRVIVDLATARCADLIVRDKPLADQHKVYRLIRDTARAYVRHCDAICEMLKLAQIGGVSRDSARETLSRIDSALVPLQEFRYHIIERSRAYPQAVGIDKKAGHDKYVTLALVTGLIDIGELHAVSSSPYGRVPRFCAGAAVGAILIKLHR
jgi:hypothetical protein